MQRPTALVLMFGHSDANDVRRLVQQARLASTEDLLLQAGDCDWQDIIFCSNSPEVLGGGGVSVQRLANEMDPFHFGRELQALVRRAGLQEHNIIYAGGGLPLLSAATLAQMQEHLAANDRVAITNNLHSCDFIGWTPGSAVLDIHPPDTDNDLAWQLRRGGLEITELPRTAETIFDIDTPTDLLLLSYAAGLGPNLNRVLASLPASKRLPDIMPVLRSFERTALCYGRISHHAWAYFAQRVASQTRIFSEERSMRANGRLARGEVRSLLGLLADQVGFEATFNTLTNLADTIILDTRVLMAHHRQWPSIEDRFHSDLGEPDAIEDPWLRQMTRAALDCGVPTLLGGHCLVSGALYLLADAVGPKEYPLL